MTSGNFRHFLQLSLAIVEEERPEGYVNMASALGVRDVHVEVDKERLAICGDGHQLTVVDGALRPNAYARASTGALRAILAGTHSIETAVFAELIHLRGSLEDLVAFNDALRAYFSAAVRCPSFAALLDDYVLATQAAFDGESPHG